jgi:hypothetical protein
VLNIISGICVVAESIWANYINVHTDGLNWQLYVSVRDTEPKPYITLQAVADYWCEREDRRRSVAKTLELMAAFLEAVRDCEVQPLPVPVW